MRCSARKNRVIVPKLLRSHRSGQRDGSVDDNLLVQFCRNQTHGISQGRENEPADLSPQRFEEQLVAHQRDSATDHNDVRREQRDHLRDAPTERDMRLMERSKGDPISVGRRLRDHLGGELLDITHAAAEQISGVVFCGNLAAVTVRPIDGNIVRGKRSRNDH